MIDPRLEKWIQSYSPESQIALRRDLERYGTFEQQALFATNVHIDRMERMLAFVDDLQKPFYVKIWEWLKSFCHKLTPS